MEEERKIPSYEDQIIEIMDEFDFHKVRDVMTFMNWKWAFTSSEDGIPTLGDIRRSARNLLKNVSKEELEVYHFVSSGGLTAYNFEGKLSLQFVVTSHDGFTF